SEGVIDIGSGAGLPGIPLKIWEPALTAKLIEANHKKATFLREVVRALDLARVEVVADRAENVSTQADLVMFRAVERFGQILAVASRLVSANGRVAILIGESQVETAKSALPDF